MFLFCTGLHCGTTTKNQWLAERSYEQPELTNTVKIVTPVRATGENCVLKICVQKKDQETAEKPVQAAVEEGKNCSQVRRLSKKKCKSTKVSRLIQKTHSEEISCTTTRSAVGSKHFSHICFEPEKSLEPILDCRVGHLQIHPIEVQKDILKTESCLS